MSTNEQAPARGHLATMVATASITLALGVTAAALTGYLRAPERPAEAAPAGAQTVEASAPNPALNATPTAAPTVVLVPVTREPRPAAPAPTGDALFASYQAEERDDDNDDRSARGRQRDEGRDDEDSDSDD